MGGHKHRRNNRGTNRKTRKSNILQQSFALKKQRGGKSCQNNKKKEDQLKESESKLFKWRKRFKQIFKRVGIIVLVTYIGLGFLV